MRRRFGLQRLEVSIEEAAVEKIKQLFGILGLKFNTRSGNGWPDRIFLIPGGRPLFIEFKRPGKDLEPLQADVHRQLREIGYDVEAADNIPDAVDLVAAALQRALATVAAGRRPEAGDEVPH